MKVRISILVALALLAPTLALADDTLAIRQANAQQANVAIHEAFEKVGWLYAPTNEQKIVPLFNTTNIVEGATMSAGIGVIGDEIFSIIAEIAVERAKRRGLAVVKQKIEQGVCELRLNIWSGDKPGRNEAYEVLDDAVVNSAPVVAGRTYRLATTCKLVHDTELQALIGQGRALRAAVTSDVVDIAAGEIEHQFTAFPPLAKSASAAVALVKRFATDPDAQLTKNDVWLVTDAFLNATWDPPGNNDDLKILQMALAAARTYLEAIRLAQDPKEVDLAVIVRMVIEKYAGNVVDKPANHKLLLEWTNLAIRAASATKEEQSGIVDDLRERLRATLTLAFDAYERVAQNGGEFARWARLISLAAVDGDAPHLISSLADVAKLGAEKKCRENPNACPRLEKLTALLTGISTYALTFEDVDLSDATPEQKAAIAAEKRAARKEVLESVIDATTDRRGRGGDWVWSLGSGVGAMLGGEERVKAGSEPVSSANGAEKAKSFDVALHVPVGITFQRLPRRLAWKDIGFHLGLNVLDLGYYLGTEGQPAPDWQAILAPGIEIGIPVVLRAQNSFFVIGYTVARAPRYGEASDGQQRTSTRRGFFVQYSLPLFDFN